MVEIELAVLGNVLGEVGFSRFPSRPIFSRDARQISNRCRSVCIGCGVEWFGLAWIGLRVVAWG